MSEYLWRKTRAYEDQLAAAVAAASPSGTPDSRAGDECLEMAEAYLADGRHFLAGDDLTNALAAFSYGHGWLDAGVRLGVLDADEEGLFTI